MEQATTSPTVDPALAAIQDRIEITDVLYRYASTIDKFDLEGLRGTLADEIRAVLVRHAEADPAFAQRIAASYQRIVALKQRIGAQ